MKRLGHSNKEQRELALGKLPPEILRRYLLDMTGASSDDLLVPPSIGVDFGVVRGAGGNLIVSSDPVTGVLDRIGEYAVNVSANDVATSGNRPRFLQSVILLPEEVNASVLAKISSDMDRTAKGLRITIVGGHTEVTPGLKRPIVITTAFTFAEKFVTAAQAREGDAIMITKTAGVEGTAILASAVKGLSPALASRARSYFKRLSVVEEAASAYETGRVHAMHDCTEGGMLGAIYEMSYASGLGFELLEKEIPVSEETATICRELKIDPLRLISSGTLLLAVDRDSEALVSGAIAAAGSSSTVVGRFRKGERVMVRRSGRRERVDGPPIDELWKVMHRRRTRLAAQPQVDREDE